MAPWSVLLEPRGSWEEPVGRAVLSVLEGVEVASLTRVESSVTTDARS